MMQLGVVDYYSFRGVCKSWRSIACSNKSMFMGSRPPMSITSISSSAHEKTYHPKDFEGGKFKIKTTLPHSAEAAVCVGLTCGYLIFFDCDFWLVNPITREELHFHDFPGSSIHKAILLVSPSMSGWVFVVLCGHEVWFCIAGKGAWNHVSCDFRIRDIYAFKGKIYTLSYNIFYPLHECFRLCELRLNPEPKFIVLVTKSPSQFHPQSFISSHDALYVYGNTPDFRFSLHELDLGEMKWVKMCEKTIGEYAFFYNLLNNSFAAVKRESWADPHGRFALSLETDNNGKDRFFTAEMWYFPHECMKVDHVDM